MLLRLADSSLDSGHASPSSPHCMPVDAGGVHFDAESAGVPCHQFLDLFCPTTIINKLGLPPSISHPSPKKINGSQREVRSFGLGQSN